ncbi:anthranilate synthase component I family protein [Ferruginibacter sp. SUN106]|uniref:anthranilate synthase component I family protein n=1 Tax=Ferruginibacter sp. SUN106 TaxID=2978348 RepID=UPI003D36FA61
MNKNSQTFSLNNFTEFRIQMLNWANRFNIFCLLDNQHYNFTTPAFECLLAAGSKKNITAHAGNAFESLQHFYNENKGWLFGHLGYDLKNETEKLHSRNYDGIGFEDMHFFVPEIVLQLSETQVTIFTDGNATEIIEAIQQEPSTITQNTPAAIAVTNRIAKEDYISIIQKLRQHILRGDCYEINFCQEFFAADAVIDPLYVYHKLIQLSPNPFAALYKINERFCICASPERYVKKEGNKIISQPIKGTSKRDLLSKEHDLQNKNYLSQNEKEKSENVMVVDLVRNDLSKVCKQGTVKVEELFGVYSFPQVHQMISTISGEIKDNISWIDIIKATFPMGSMTGAPKKSVMELIEQYEQTRRGLFSGSIGYINPEGDFDFNVVIRSMFYNASNRYLSFQAGGGITFYSDAEKEYEESLLKAVAMMKVLE